MLRQLTGVLVWACALVIAAGCGVQPVSPSHSPSPPPSPTLSETATPSEPEIALCSPEDPLPSAEPDTVLVFFTCGPIPTASVVPVYRPANGDTVTDRLTAALDGLLAGPTGEEGTVGLRSWFSSETADSLNGVQVDDAGRAIVDFADFSDLIPNASTAAGRRQLLAELRSTIFQFDEVEAVELWFDGTCSAFWAWLQTTCTPLIRGDG